MAHIVQTGGTARRFRRIGSWSPGTNLGRASHDARRIRYPRV